MSEQRSLARRLFEPASIDSQSPVASVVTYALLLLWALVVLPLTFLGAIYYPWSALDAVPWLQVIVLLISTVYVLTSLLADLVYAVLDPRIRLAR